MSETGPPALALAFLLAVAGCLGGVGASADTGPADPTPVGEAPTSMPPPDSAGPVRVVEVVDGDTVTVEYPNGTREDARLLGVDTPEVHAETDPAEFEGVPRTAAGRACLRRWGERASEYARERLLGERVRIAFDGTEPRRGYYGRLLVYVHAGGAEFNYGLLVRGLARVYDSGFDRRPRYEAAENRARKAGSGLWTCRTPDETAPTLSADATTTPSGVVVERVQADAEGRDGENLNDEYVLLRNEGTESVDLGGWTLRDAAGHVYRSPSGATLGPGGTVRVHTESGEDTATDRYWGASGPVWNNDGDTVTLRDTDGDVVDRFRYGG